MNAVTLEQADRIVAAALTAGRENGMMPLTVAVLDTGGHPVALKREDGSGILRPQIACGKAWGAIGMGKSSRALAGMAEERPAFMNALMAASGGRLVPVPGGVLIRDAAGALIGSVGVTGDTSDNDEVAAVAGIEAAGLTAETG